MHYINSLEFHYTRRLLLVSYFAAGERDAKSLLSSAIRQALLLRSSQDCLGIKPRFVLAVCFAPVLRKNSIIPGSAIEGHLPRRWRPFRVPSSRLWAVSLLVICSLSHDSLGEWKCENCRVCVQYSKQLFLLTLRGFWIRCYCRDYSELVRLWLWVSERVIFRVPRLFSLYSSFPFCLRIFAWDMFPNWSSHCKCVSF